MYPVWKRLKAKGYNVKIIDYDANRALADKYGVRSLPTTVVVKNGKMVGKEVGVVSANDIIRHTQ